MLGLQLPHTYTLTLPAHCITLQVTIPELKGKYAPFFELLVDTIKNKKLLKCKLCADGTTLSYNGINEQRGCCKCGFIFIPSFA